MDLYEPLIEEFNGRKYQSSRQDAGEKSKKKDSKREALWLLKTLLAKCRTAEILSKLAVNMM